MATSEEMNTGIKTELYPSAGEDFFRHVNGEWLETTEIPSDKPRWGTYDVLSERTLERLKSIVDECLARDDIVPGSNEQKVRDEYLAVTNMERRNELGLAPLDGIRRKISEITNGLDALELIAELRSNGLMPFFLTGVGEDIKAAGSNILYLEQGGLGLSNKQMYFDDDEKSQHIREEYEKYRRVLFQLAGYNDDQAAEAAEGAYRIELALAEASQTPTEERDIEKNYHKYTRKEAVEAFSTIDWSNFFAKLGDDSINEFVIMQPDFIRRVGEILRDFDTRDLKSYMELRALDSFAGSLTEDVSNASFAFHGEVMYGIKEQPPLWKKAVARITGSSLKHAVGPLYCEQFFDNDSKLKLTEMVGDVKDAFREHVLALDWMTDETKAKTLAKLDHITFKMGYPDEWEDISAIDIKPDALMENSLTMAKFNFNRQLADLHRPYDTSRWVMPPTMVNACSDQKREMTFPAAVLQAPFFDPKQDDAYNYGAIGCTMGHELTHFFDDKGCKFDIDGNMNDWWSDADRTSFEALTDRFVEYFGSLSANGIQVDGKLTLGENIADVAGIKISYQAYQKKRERDGDSSHIIDDMTPEQRFFTGWARKWRGKITPELARRYSQTDPHSPYEVRVNGVLAITPEFHQAFNLSEGDAMYVAPADQPKIW